MDNGLVNILYIGSTKLVALRGRLGQEGGIHLESFCRCPAIGFKDGAVSDLDRAHQQLQVLLRNFFSSEEALRSNFYVIMSSPSLRGYFFNSSIYFGETSRMVSQNDVLRVVGQTRTVATIPLDEMIIHTISQEYIVNDVAGIKNPVGMDGRRLGVTLLLFAVKLSVLKNLQKLLEKENLVYDRFIPRSVASSYAVLKEHERHDGVCLIDIGGNTTDVLYYKNDDILVTRTLNCGGETITQHLVEQLSISAREAKKLKEKFGSCRVEDIDEERIPVHDAFGSVRTHIRRKELCDSVRAGAEMWMSQVNPIVEEIKKDYKQLNTIVITGGGATLDGLLEYTQEMWSGLEVRLGLVQKIHGPQEVVLGSAQYSACLGLLTAEYHRRQAESQIFNAKGLIAKTIHHAREWIEEYF